MRILITTAVLIQTLVMSVQASTVGWGAAIDRGVGLSSPTTATTAVLAGSLVRLGYYINTVTGLPLSNTEIQALASPANPNNKSNLDAAFRQYGQAQIGDGVGGENGVWSASSSNSQAQFGGRTAYYWILNAPSLGATTQYAIVTAAQFVFPADTATGQLTTDINQVTAQGIVVGEGFGTATIFGSPGVPVVKLAPVPEPATAFLSVVGLAAIASRRRRNRH